MTDAAIRCTVFLVRDGGLDALLATGDHAEGDGGGLAAALALRPAALILPALERLAAGANAGRLSGVAVASLLGDVAFNDAAPVILRLAEAPWFLGGRRRP